MEQGRDMRVQWVIPKPMNGCKKYFTAALGDDRFRPFSELSNTMVLFWVFPPARVHRYMFSTTMQRAVSLHILSFDHVAIIHPSISGATCPRVTVLLLLPKYLCPISYCRCFNNSQRWMLKSLPSSCLILFPACGSTSDVPFVRQHALFYFSPLTLPNVTPYPDCAAVDVFAAGQLQLLIIASTPIGARSLAT